MRRRLVILPAALAVTVATVLFAVTPGGAVEPGGSFVDDDGIPAEGYIEALVEAGVVNGCSADEFCPQATLSRAQLAAFLARALDLPPATGDHFTDDDGAVLEDAINRIADAGIAAGVGGGRFDPSGQVSRGQVASFLARGFAFEPSSDNWYVDDDGSVHEPNIDAGRTAEVLEACAAGADRYCPTDLLVRSDMATFVAKAMGLPPVVVPPRDGTTTTTTPPGGEPIAVCSDDGSASCPLPTLSGPARAVIDNNGEGPFVVEAVNGDGQRTELVSTTGPFDGERTVPADSTSLDITADAGWSIQVFAS